MWGMMNFIMSTKSPASITSPKVQANRAPKIFRASFLFIVTVTVIRIEMLVNRYSGLRVDIEMRFLYLDGSTGWR